MARDPTIKERLAVVENDVKYIKKLMWGLVAACLGNIGIKAVPVVSALIP